MDIRQKQRGRTVAPNATREVARGYRFVELGSCWQSRRRPRHAARVVAAAPPPPSRSGKTLTIGYSAWPGWFPLAVAEEAGIFEEVGLTSSSSTSPTTSRRSTRWSAGTLDANTQTLNDTMAGVAAGSKQAIVVVNDNSAGNDAIICDESIGNIDPGPEGQDGRRRRRRRRPLPAAAGAGAVGLTQDDIDFRGVLTDAAAGAFAGGQFDCVGVFAPFTLEALKRPGSHVVFSSADFPGTIPDHIVVSQRRS